MLSVCLIISPVAQELVVRALLNKLAPIKDANLVRVLDRREPAHPPTGKERNAHRSFKSFLCVLVLSLSWQQTIVFHKKTVCTNTLRNF